MRLILLILALCLASVIAVAQLVQPMMMSGQRPAQTSIPAGVKITSVSPNSTTFTPGLTAQITQMTATLSNGGAFSGSWSMVTTGNATSPTGAACPNNSAAFTVTSAGLLSSTTASANQNYGVCVAASQAGLNPPNPYIQLVSLTPVGSAVCCTINSYLMGGGGQGAAQGVLQFFATYNNKNITGCGTEDCIPHPMEYAITPVDNTSQFAALAAGTYNQCTQSVYNECGRAVPNAPYLYTVRICNEWQGSTLCGPFVNGDESQGTLIDAATWVAGVRNFIAQFKATSPALANVKIGWDAPFTPLEANYYPGDDVIDYMNFDAYIGSSYSSDGTGASAWNNISCSTNSPSCMLTYQYSFAQAHGKPIAFLEWCDGFPDGGVIAGFGPWMNSHQVVAQLYWDDTDDGLNACGIDSSTQKRNNFFNVFSGHTSANGYFWPVIIPWM